MESHSYSDLIKSFDRLISHLATNVYQYNQAIGAHFGFADDYLIELHKRVVVLVDALNLYIQDGNHIREDHALRKFKLFLERGLRAKNIQEVESERQDVLQIVRDARSSIKEQHLARSTPTSKPKLIKPAVYKTSINQPSDTPRDPSLVLFIFGRILLGLPAFAASYFVWVNFPGWIGAKPTPVTIARVAATITIFGGTATFLNLVTRKK